MSKSIFSKGFIYEGVVAPVPMYQGEYAGESKYIPLIDLDYYRDQVCAFEAIIKMLPNFPVLNSHNFKEGQEVVEGKDYEKKYQSWYTTEYRLCDIERYNNSSPDMRRIVALPLNVSVQEEKEDVLAFKFMMGNAFSKYESKHGNYDDLKNDLIRAFNKAKDIPSPAATEPTTNAGIDKGEGKEITAMRELIEHIKGHYAWFMEHSPDYGVVPKILDKVTSLLAKEREQIEKAWRDGRTQSVLSTIESLQDGSDGIKISKELDVKQNQYFTTHYSQIKP